MTSTERRLIPKFCSAVFSRHFILSMRLRQCGAYRTFTALTMFSAISELHPTAHHSQTGPLRYFTTSQPFDLRPPVRRFCDCPFSLAVDCWQLANSSFTG